MTGTLQVNVEISISVSGDVTRIFEVKMVAMTDVNPLSY